MQNTAARRRARKKSKWPGMAGNMALNHWRQQQRQQRTLSNIRSVDGITSPTFVVTKKNWLGGRPTTQQGNSLTADSPTSDWTVEDHGSRVGAVATPYNCEETFVLKRTEVVDPSTSACALKHVMTHGRKTLLVNRLNPHRYHSILMESDTYR